ncbi:MAG: type I methionyl aminopeptidase [Planctomycetota bacterium]
MIVYKSQREIELMRQTGQHAHRILRDMAAICEPGVTTAEVNEVCRRELAKIDGIGLSKNYPTYKPGEGYPAESCISVNEEVVHGIPGPRKLLEGDLVTLDLAMKWGEYCADTAITVAIGELSPQRHALMDMTRQTLDYALSAIKPGVRWSKIATAMQKMVEKQGYGVVREFVGHGIGRSMHEDPKVPNFTNAEQLKSDFVLRKGMTFAVEPMVVIGTRKVKTLADEWTVVSKNGKPACHFEHTVAVTEDGCDVLTDGRASAA